MTMPARAQPQIVAEGPEGAVLLALRVVADLETPVSAFLKLFDGAEHAFLLESVEGGDRLGRYSAFGGAPDLLWRLERGAAAIWRRADDAAGFVPETAAPLDSLRALLARSAFDMPAELPPMAAGLFGYLGYDLVRQIERLPDTKPDRLGVPEAVLIRPLLVGVFDLVERHLTLFTPVRDGERAAGAERLARALEALARPLPVQAPLPAVRARPALTPSSNTGKDAYLGMVERARAYIHAGDVFQVLPSQRFQVPFTRPPFELYRALRRLNPSPFLFHLMLPGFAVIGSSPEILVRVRGRQVTIRPLAGTRRRGATPAEDQALAADLLADPKERSEHLMLLDLGRNDVGRVAAPGSVRVTEAFQIERYSHVMHMVSNVEGELTEGLDVIDALAAGFPAGTVTGAPKVRAMEIIDEMEVARRGIYGGTIGYFGAGGALDTCIALRTGVVKDGQLYVQAGAGIVADSVAESEHEETVIKARALIAAAAEAEALLEG